MERSQMKLNSRQLQRVEEQLGVQAIPEEHPATIDLEETFGKHTFFLDREGLNIVEPALSKNSGGNVVKLASWSSEARTELLSHRPEVLPVSVDLEDPDEPEPAA
jgi:hypothetical protein